MIYRNHEVHTLVFGTLESTVLSAGRGAGAERRVPGVTGVAVVILVSLVVAEPSPVGVEDDLALLGGAASSGGALLDGNLGVVLSGDAAGLLAQDHSGEGEGNESCLGKHGRKWELEKG